MNPEMISRRQFYTLGAFSNPRLFRRMRRAAWRYYRDRS